MERFTDTVALVTGGSSGIGKAVAVRLASEGAAVVLGSRRPDVGEAVAERIRRNGGRAIFLRTDVTREPDVERLVADAIGAFGRLDAVFNNAASTAPAGPVDQLASDDWARELDTNLTSVFYCLKHEIAAMSRGGAILNNASIAAVSGTPGMAAYTAAKHGVLGLTRATALECADREVRVNALITGNVDTPLYRELSGVGPHDELPTAPNPTGRTATPDEVAGFVAYLLSSEAAFITGAALAFDGGFTAS